MPSLNPCTYHSGSVHDSDSESSLEYVQAQSQISPNISLKTPIASSTNVSGLKINVGIVIAQASITCSIPNISLTLIHKFMCLRAHEAHKKFHPRLIHNPNFHVTTSLIQVGILWSPQNPLGKVNSYP
ncbi:hypothetical protein O181_020612 [Austropuccinia psidii MF-1]|uniref:Uncharacterized protein n=1 Tax=Austropuccinia psidii MF-1 TaxID=1389203 RepID=A0A9Q3GVG8_9BASI|nr:hypothetical protein [Austropuccinia psidii MF-1]